MEWDDVERAAMSPDWEIRASASVSLAERWPDSDVVQSLLADPDDLAVTEAMGWALLKEPSEARLRAFVRGYASAADQHDHPTVDVHNDTLRAAVGMQPELLDRLRDLAESEPGARRALEWLG